MPAIIDQQGKVFADRNSDANGVADGINVLNDITVNKPFHKVTDKTPSKTEKLDDKMALTQLIDVWTPEVAYDKDLYLGDKNDQGEHIALYNRFRSSGLILEGITTLSPGQNANRNPLLGGADTYNAKKDGSNAYGKDVLPK